MRAVVALGGNALSPPGGDGGIRQMRAALARTADALGDLAADGVELVLTHGNGPQVGRILLQQEYAAAHVPPMPMDVCGAQSQGQIGYLLAQAVDGALRARGLGGQVLSLITQVVVDGRDPAFRRPTKPVGPDYEEAAARQIAHQTGHVFQAMPDGRWRRVVASPRPRRLAEQDVLRALVDAGHLVVAAGGGGVPVVEHGGRLHGVEAVVDKDLTAALLATLVGADLLLILTAVPRVQRGYGTPGATDLTTVDSVEARRLLAAGEFPAGSMGPKVEACCRFVEAGGRVAVIAGLDRARAAALGDEGTRIVPPSDGQRDG